MLSASLFFAYIHIYIYIYGTPPPELSTSFGVNPVNAGPDPLPSLTYQSKRLLYIYVYCMSADVCRTKTIQQMLAYMPARVFRAVGTVPMHPEY